MSKSERIMAFAVTLVVLLVVEVPLMIVGGVSSHHIFWAAFSQIMLAMFIMALADPTYRHGYVFAVIVSLAAISFFLADRPFMISEGCLLSVSCVGTTWGTYELRRRWNWYRARQRSYN